MNAAYNRRLSSQAKLLECSSAVADAETDIAQLLNGDRCWWTGLLHALQHDSSWACLCANIDQGEAAYSR